MVNNIVIYTFATTDLLSIIYEFSCNHYNNPRDVFSTVILDEKKMWSSYICNHYSDPTDDSILFKPILGLTRDIYQRS